MPARLTFHSTLHRKHRPEAVSESPFSYNKAVSNREMGDLKKKHTKYLKHKYIKDTKYTKGVYYACDLSLLMLTLAPMQILAFLIYCPV